MLTPGHFSLATVDAGDTLTMTYTKTGSGLALAGFTVQITYKLNDPS